MLPLLVGLTVPPVSASIGMISIYGDSSACSVQALLDAYRQATDPFTHVLILKCCELKRMNSVGIARLISLPIQLRRNQQRLLACEPSAHDRHLLELTRLSEVIGLYATEAEALHAANPF